MSRQSGWAVAPYSSSASRAARIGAGRARAATEQWLNEIGMPYDDLHCSYDKVTRCVELGIDVLVDDSPVNLRGARAEGILGATIVHPWNHELVGTDGVIGAANWP